MQLRSQRVRPHHRRRPPRGIAAGEELACGYWFNSGASTAWNCNCRSRRCGRPLGWLALLGGWFRQEHAAEIE